MIYYKVTMQHTEKTFERLAHMQYDLFSRGNRVGRSIISLAALIGGALNLSEWWGALLILYGSYMTSSTYSAANHKARKLVKAIRDSGLNFPASRYVFEDHAMNVITLPEETSLGEPLAYSDICRLGEDTDYFYLFRDQLGGYMIPKEALGKKEEAFRLFIEKKSGQHFRSNFAPIIKLIRKLWANKQRPSK